MNEFLGPLNWRPTSTSTSTSTVDTRELSLAAPTRNSIFASAPKTKKSSPAQVASSEVSTSRWLPMPSPNLWSMNSNAVNYYRMRFQRNLKQFQNQDVQSSHSNKWGNYMKTHSFWG